MGKPKSCRAFFVSLSGIVAATLFFGCDNSVSSDNDSSPRGTDSADTPGTSAQQTDTHSAESPQFSIAPGAYKVTTEVALSSNSGSEIYYTTDGTIPDATSTRYDSSSGIALLEDVTINAIAINGAATSEVATAAYTVTAFYPDFDLHIQTGSSWSFHWMWKHTVNYSYTDQPFTVENDFTITLGEPREISGITFFETICEFTTGTLAGQSADGKIRWKYLAYAKDKMQLLGSTDGATYTILFDAWFGFWPGQGFFSEFDEDQPLSVAESGGEYTLSQGWHWSDNDSVYYPGTGTIYDPDPYSSYSNTTETYRNGIGPYFSKSSGGTTHASSSTGDTYTFTLNEFSEATKSVGLHP